MATTHRAAIGRCRALGLAALGLAFLAGCASTAPPGPQAGAVPDGELIIVAVDDSPEPLPAAGATPRSSYSGGINYAGSTRALAVAAEVARDHGLREQSAWSIGPLKLRCMLFRIPPGADRSAVLAEVARDPHVQLAQPLNSFETLGAAIDDRYNDPYVGLQRGFAAIDAAEAQRWSQGDGVRVALIDTGIDADHPDLDGRIAGQRDFVSAAHPPAAGGERHGTEMAGLIAADANNRIGIVGVAPMARLLAYRACWPVAGGGSRCDSFTLARALSAAIAADADVINLSLGGPPDPLLQRLAEQAMQRGAIIVGAVPPGGGMEGFPVGVPGVLAVESSDDEGLASRVLAAPANDILTLVPGGHYGYASGSSLAAAQVSGAVALLRALYPGLRAPTAQAWLERPLPSARAPVDLCHAVRRVRSAAACGRLAQTGPSAAP